MFLDHICIIQGVLPGLKVNLKFKVFQGELEPEKAQLSLSLSRQPHVNFDTTDHVCFLASTGRPSGRFRACMGKNNQGLIASSCKTIAMSAQALIEQHLCLCFCVNMADSCVGVTFFKW